MKKVLKYEFGLLNNHTEPKYRQQMSILNRTNTVSQYHSQFLLELS